MAVNICEVSTFSVSNFMNKLKSKINIRLENLLQITFNFHFLIDIFINERFLARVAQSSKSSLFFA